MPEETNPNAGAENAEKQPGVSGSNAEAPIGNLDAEALRKTLEEEKNKAEAYLANWQRAAADLINYKRRSEQEKNDTVAFANAMLISSILPVLDDMERAFDSVPSKLAGLTWVEGMKLVYKKLGAILEAQGLSEIKTVGETFDPRLHEAIAYIDGAEGKIVEEAQRGYRFKDKVIRPAMVKVGKGQPEAEAAPKKEPGPGVESGSSK